MQNDKIGQIKKLNNYSIFKSKAFESLIVISLIFFAGIINNSINRDEKIQKYITKRAILIDYIDYSQLMDSIYNNYNDGLFFEDNHANLRAFQNALGILYIIQEFWEFDLNYIVESRGSLQGENGGFFYEIGDVTEYSFTSYYLLQSLSKFDFNIISKIDIQHFSEYLTNVYNQSTGEFLIHLLGTSNILANWMIIYTIFNLNIENQFDLTKNIEYCESNANSLDIQTKFSSIVSLYFLNNAKLSNYGSSIYTNYIANTFLNSSDVFERYYGLLTLDFLGISPTKFLSEDYLNLNLQDLNIKLEAKTDLNGIYACISIIALILGVFNSFDLIL